MDGSLIINFILPSGYFSVDVRVLLGEEFQPEN